MSCGRNAQRRRSAFGPVVAAIVAWSLVVGATGAAGAPSSSIGRVRAVITFVGDANISLSATARAGQFTWRNSPYAIVDVATAAAGIRHTDCRAGTTCSSNDYWRDRLAETNDKIASDAYVVDLGIIDTLYAGTATGPGYSSYGTKIDWMMGLFGGKPTYWTNLPCALEPRVLAPGCAAVNTALAGAPSRWPNLTVIDWAAVANARPEFMASASRVPILHTWTGSDAWASIVAAAVDADFPLSAPAGRIARAIDPAGGAPVIALVGDSNITLGATMTALTFSSHDPPWTMVNLARPGATIRFTDCSPSPCATYDFWKARLEDAKPKIASDAYIVNLGINDTTTPGGATGPGYANYPAKIDWLMDLLDGRPVFWTNLPCAIEPPGAAPATGCAAVNAALAGAPSRWPNLTVVDWASVANPRRDYMQPFDVHYTAAGHRAWAATVAQALDGVLPD